MDISKPLVLVTCSLLISCTAMRKPPEAPLGTQQSIRESTTPSSAITITPNTKTTSEPITTAGHEQRKPLSAWQLSGAMAARNKNKGWSASLKWAQQGINNYHIHLSGPLGGGTILIDKEGGVVTYRDGPKTITSNNADTLLLKQTGVQLPVHDLYYWVQGLTAPGKAIGKQYVGSQLVKFQQAGYVINYGQYQRVGDRILPSKVHLQGHGVVIKLVIKNWAV